jgi:gamma-glutamyltranspeptidase / glutathione hydrolase
MVATSQPLATRAGLRALERGGNAADAAVAAAATLCVTEPMSTGIGGDAFAVVWRAGVLSGLDAAGPAPMSADPAAPVEKLGPRSVTVPGAVQGWAALANAYGRLGLDACLADAIDVAERGFAAGVRTAASWAAGTMTGLDRAAAGPPTGFAPAPRLGQRIRLHDLAATLRKIADDGPAAIYSGPVAEAIARVSWLDEADLSGYAARWVEPLRHRYRDVEVIELPPPTQGVAALEALALLEGFEPTLLSRVVCARLALEDALANVRDGADVGHLLGSSYVARRRSMPGLPVVEPGGGTVYLCAVDSDRTAVSFIQSLYGSFGSGIVAPGTGIILNNRCACFEVSGRVEPGRRPYHTIIPGMLLSGGALLGPFGVMGGFIQAQAHLQLVSALIDDGEDPQRALDRPRFRVDGERLHLEEGLWPFASELEGLGMSIVCADDTIGFGGGQAIMLHGDSLVGGSDPRKDGYAAGY